MRSDLGRILLPRIEDVTADNVDALKDRLKEQDIVRSLGGRLSPEHTFQTGDLSQQHVSVLKDNGFRVFQAHRGLDPPQTLILWGKRKLDSTLLRHHWSKPEEFVKL